MHYSAHLVTFVVFSLRALLAPRLRALSVCRSSLTATTEVDIDAALESPSFQRHHIIFALIASSPHGDHRLRVATWLAYFRTSTRLRNSKQTFHASAWNKHSILGNHRSFAVRRWRESKRSTTHDVSRVILFFCLPLRHMNILTAALIAGHE